MRRKENSQDKTIKIRNEDNQIHRNLFRSNLYICGSRLVEILLIQIGVLVFDPF